MSGHLDALVRELADAMKGDGDELSVRLRKAVVFAQSPLTVKIGGSDVAVPVQATGPIPANGTVVWVLESGPRRVLLTASGIRSTGGDTITASAASVIPLVVKGAASQTANLLEARDDAGTVLARVDSIGRPVFGLVDPGGQVGVATQFPGRPGLVVRGAASQTANLAEFQNSAGTVLTSILAGGQIVAWITDSTGASGASRTLQMGAPDSAGAGFRTVRVVN